jgi:hypothetical protein
MDSATSPMCLGLAYALRASYSRRHASAHLTPVQYHRAACDNGLSCGLRRVPCAAPALEPLVAGAAFICSSLHLGPHSHRHRSTLALRRIPSTFTASPALPCRTSRPTSARLRLPALPSTQERPHTPEDHSTTAMRSGTTPPFPVDNRFPITCPLHNHPYHRHPSQRLDAHASHAWGSRVYHYPWA